MQAESSLVGVDLTFEERELLCAGLARWGGHAHPTDALALAMGYTDVSDLLAESERLHGSLEEGEALSSFDLVRALVATEIAFASDVFGAGVEWATVTGKSDQETVQLLRGVQRKIVDGRDSLRQRGG